VTGSNTATIIAAFFKSTWLREHVLEPGQMLSWSLNSPHRVDNADCMNISVTSDHWMNDNRCAPKMHLANAVLRHRPGLRASRRSQAGPCYWAQSALEAAWRRSPWRTIHQRQMRSVDCRPDLDAAGGCSDIAAGFCVGCLASGCHRQPLLRRSHRGHGCGRVVAGPLRTRGPYALAMFEALHASAKSAHAGSAAELQVR